MDVEAIDLEADLDEGFVADRSNILRHKIKGVARLEGGQMLKQCQLFKAASLESLTTDLEAVCGAD